MVHPTAEGPAIVNVGAKWRRRILILLVFTGLLALLFHLIISARWNRFTEEHDELLKRLSSESRPRLPSAGPRQSGSAWDGYAEAFGLLPAMTSAQREAVDRVIRGVPKPGDDEIGDAVLIASERAMERFRDAARCEADPPPMGSGPYMQLTSSRSPIRLFTFSVRRRSERGDIAGALEDGSASARMALDVCNGPNIYWSMSGSYQLFQIVEELRRALLRSEASETDLRAGEELLEAIDRQYPGLETVLDLHLAWLGQLLREMPVTGDSPGISWKNYAAYFGGKKGEEHSEAYVWRRATRGFSTRILKCEIWEAHVRFREAAREAGELPWKAAEGVLDKAILRYASTWNPYLLHPALGRFENAHRDTRARIRISRAAVQLRLGLSAGNPRWPQDPYSMQPIHSRTAGDETILWSEGTDGDQGGAGDWRFDQGSGDIVLRVPNR